MAEPKVIAVGFEETLEAFRRAAEIGRWIERSKGAAVFVTPHGINPGCIGPEVLDKLEALPADHPLRTKFKPVDIRAGINYFNSGIFGMAHDETQPPAESGYHITVYHSEAI